MLDTRLPKLFNCWFKYHLADSRQIAIPKSPETQKLLYFLPLLRVFLKDIFCHPKPAFLSSQLHLSGALAIQKMWSVWLIFPAQTVKI